MKTPKREIGDTGEGIVCKYLQNKGFSVIERNYLKPWGEIDIVAKKAKKLYFIEVKTVSRELSNSSADEVPREPAYRPEENVHPAKLKRLHRAIQTYLLDHRIPEDIEWQLDIACAYLDFSTHKARIEMLENVIL